MIINPSSIEIWSRSFKFISKSLSQKFALRYKSNPYFLVNLLYNVVIKVAFRKIMVYLIGHKNCVPSIKYDLYKLEKKADLYKSVCF